MTWYTLWCVRSRLIP